MKISKEHLQGGYIKGSYLRRINEYGEYNFIYDKKSSMAEVENKLCAKGILYSFLKDKELNKIANNWLTMPVEEKEEIIQENNDFFLQGALSYDDDTQRSKTSKKRKNLSLTLNKMDLFDDFFDNKIIGQNEVLQEIKQQLIHVTYNLENDSRPAGIFFFVGPTGVGKTEVCKQLSQFLYSNEKINRFDMSEYKSGVGIQKLIGAPNGYVGYEEGGILINSMINNPNSVVLFDEIEKADKTVFDLFLQILDEGFVTSNKGERISFKNNLIIFTSNIGANLISDEMDQEEINDVILNEVNNFFSYELNRPEILGRIGIDNILVFNLINQRQDLYKILDIYFNKFGSNLNNKKISISFNRTPVYNEILKNIDITKGARDIRNQFDVFQKKFMMSLYDNKLNFDDLKNSEIYFEYKNGVVGLSI